MSSHLSIAKKRYSFKKAFEMIPLGQANSLKADLWNVLNIRNRTSWYNKLRGITSPSVEIVEAVSAVFKRYGIENCWEVTEL
ncbi:hypothetical protein HMPREF1981_03231 [Bacteroides pyogenes F0041]|uniref:Uncharacterized protein n=1 Tax=Bacteroides pyogenes F0041 TaxID=1321819 RepID=U2DIZ4_9BACE|nr:hypothetical protein [Bacteroides pyogenes]ERI81467.1 hypothetical protein HMPREF1981_03231 [Bacteroides pyogenes F0041]